MLLDWKKRIEEKRAKNQAVAESQYWKSHPLLQQCLQAMRGSCTLASPELHEAAVVDGANKWQRVWHIDIPGILPTVVIMFILNSGKVMAVGFEKAYLMQTSLNISTSEIIATYVYKRGLLNSQFSFSATVGMFESVINLVLILTVNFISRKVSDSSLF